MDARTPRALRVNPLNMLAERGPGALAPAYSTLGTSAWFSTNTPLIDLLDGLAPGQLDPQLEVEDQGPSR